MTAVLTTDQLQLRGIDRALHARMQVLALRRSTPGDKVGVGVLYNEALARYLQAEETA